MSTIDNDDWKLYSCSMKPILYTIRTTIPITLHSLLASSYGSKFLHHINCWLYTT